MKGIKLIKSGFKVMGRHKVRTFFMMLGIIVGVTALTMIFAFGDGAEQEIMGRIKKLFNDDNIVISSQRIQLKGGRHSSSIVEQLKVADMEALAEQIPNIMMYDSMQVMGDTEVKYQGKSSFITVYGNSPQAERVWNRSVVSGTYFTDSDNARSARVALIGSTAAKDLFGDVDPMGKEIRIGTVPFRVTGVLEDIGTDPHGNDKDNEIHVPLNTLMRRLMNVDYIAFGKLKLRDAGKMSETVAQVQAILRERHHIGSNDPDDFFLMTPVFVRKMVARANRVFDLFLPLIALISLLVGGVVVANLMLMAVSERRSEIGLRKAVGARSRDIMRQFLIEASTITGFGGLIGMAVGITAVQVASLAFKVPVAFSLQTIVTGLVFPVLVGLLSGIYPARRACRLDPIETLR